MLSRPSLDLSTAAAPWQVRHGEAVEQLYLPQPPSSESELPATGWVSGVKRLLNLDMLPPHSELAKATLPGVHGIRNICVYTLNYQY
jgi:hypothetical protein